MNTKLKAALKMSTLTPDGKVTKGQFIITSMQQAPQYFVVANLPIPFASATAAVTALHNAVLATASGNAGSVSNMHEKERLLISIFNIYRPYVEMIANATADPKTIIEAAGMTAVAVGGGTPVSELTITALGNGIMQISVPRQTGEASFIYQYSSDGGTTWQEVDCSKLASIQLKNQTPASVLHFRYAPVGKTKGSFSQVKSAIVL